MASRGCQPARSYWQAFGPIPSPGHQFVFSSPYLPLPSLQIEFVRWFKSTGIPQGYAQVVQ